MASVKKYWAIGLVTTALLTGVVALAMGTVPAQNGQYPAGVKVADVDLSGMTHEQALAALGAKATAPQVTVQTGARKWQVPASDLGWSADLEASLKPADDLAQGRSMLDQVGEMISGPHAAQFPLVVKVNADMARAKLKELTQGINAVPKNASITFDKATKKYAAVPGQVGRTVEVEQAVQSYLKNPSATGLVIPVTEKLPQYTTGALQGYVNKGNRIMRKFTATLEGTQRSAALTPLEVANLYWVREKGIVVDEKAMQAAFQRLTGVVDVPAQNARYAIQGNQLIRVGEKAGRVTVRPQAFAAFQQAVLNPEVASVVFPSQVSQPTLTKAQLPDPGKLELIARGNSTYYHSSPERRTNVANAAAKIHGTVIPAGETFSFLQALGGITPANGFVGGLIISGGRTVDGLGGGVCQVSTTTFRAMYNAGLPIVERNQHSYRVGYYEPQVGFEAAVYDPGVDLKMKNDTGAPILVKTVNNNANSTLEVQLWGIKPKRSVYVAPATILRRIPHPGPLYINNPSLARGVVRQVDWAADGYNLYITRTIKDANGTRTDRVDTFYKPWQAVYERGTR